MLRFRLRGVAAVTAAVLVLSSLALAPQIALGQSEREPGPTSLPLARQPDGRLPLEGTPWRLVGYRWKGTDRVPGPEVAARMTLDAGRFSASGGCTAFEGTYGATGSAIDFALKGLKRNGCAEQTTMVQKGMVDGLRRAARFEVVQSEEGDALVLLDRAGTELLRFGLDDISPIGDSLASSAWMLAAYVVDGVRHEPDPTATPNLLLIPEKRNEARRRASGEVLSSTGCNGFRGEFHLEANVISFGELSITDAPCAGSMAPQQDAVLEVFEATSSRVTFPADHLIMTAIDSGTSLEYLAVPALEGVTWLRSPVQTLGEGDPVTLRLEAGEASGEGPCGPYTAGYVTDGVFITFSDVGAEGAGSCERTKEQRRLLAALRNAVRIEREQPRDASAPRLILRDTRGLALIRFEYPFTVGP